MRLRFGITALAAAAVGFAVTGCGSGTAPGVALAPDQGPTQQPVVKKVATPTTGPLSKEPVFQIPSGPPPKRLVIRDLIKGHGASAQLGDRVTVNYVGKLYSTGKVFDASWRDTPGQPFAPFQLGAGAVIKGWDQGLLGMKVGGRRELIIPPGLAYRATGEPPTIPPNATLVFMVDLLAVQK